MNSETRNPNPSNEDPDDPSSFGPRISFGFPPALRFGAAGRVSGFEFRLGLLLAAFTLLTFLPVRHHAFLQFDDPEYVTGNRLVQDGLTWAGVKWAFTTFHASNWHPLTWLSHMLDCQLFGPGPAGPHLVNLAFHIANTLLLFALLRRLTGSRWRSALVAALFALHPLHVESVAWVAERKDVLSAFFFMLTLLAYGRYVAGRGEVTSHQSSVISNPISKQSVKTRSLITDHRSLTTASPSYWLCLLFFALGLLCKPMLVTLPFVLLLLDYWPLQRVSSFRFQVSSEKETSNLQSPIPLPQSAIGNRQSAIPPLGFGWLLKEKLPFFALAFASCVLTFLAQKQGGAVRSLSSFPMSDRIDNAFVACAGYLGKTFWPSELAVLYPHPGEWPRPHVLLAALLVAGLSLLALRLGRRFPFAVTGWCWFGVMLVPVIGFIQAGGQSMADRYTYLPLIGVFILAAWTLGEIAARWPRSTRWLGLAALLAVIACAAQTRAQLRHWQDSESLFRRALAVTENNATAHNNLGGLLLDAGRVEEALAHCERALAIQPDYADAHNNLGNARLQQGRLDEALEHFRAAAELQPGDASARNHLGNALLGAGRFDEAIPHYEAALQLQPDFARAHNNLGWSLLQAGRGDEALAHLQKALAIEPDYANAHNNLAFALLQQGRVREAIAHCRIAVRLQPDDAGALSNLAWLLATAADGSLRDGGEAVALAERANRLSGGRETAALRALAAAYAEVGRFAEARTTAQQALQLAELQSDPALADALREHLKLYQAGSPVREGMKLDSSRRSGAKAETRP